MAETPRQEEPEFEEVSPEELRRQGLEKNWNEIQNPEEMVTLLEDWGVNDCTRKLHLFAMACFRKTENTFYMRYDRDSIEVMESFINGNASREELYENIGSLFPGDDEANFASPYDFARHFSHLSSSVISANNEAFSHNDELRQGERLYQANILRDIFHNPFAKEPIELDPNWRTSTVVELANTIYHEKAFDRMPVLADALEDAGCTNQEVLDHCRKDQGADLCSHVRGCWVVDLILGKE